MSYKVIYGLEILLFNQDDAPAGAAGGLEYVPTSEVETLYRLISVAGKYGWEIVLDAQEAYPVGTTTVVSDLRGFCTPGMRVVETNTG